MEILIDDKSFDCSIKLFEELYFNNCLSDDKVRTYLNTPGMIFLRKHLNHYGGSDFNESIFYSLVEEATGNEFTEQEDKNIFIQSIRRGFEKVDKWKYVLKNIDLRSITHSASQMARQYLPNQTFDAINLYILFGIRGTAIVLGKEIAIDICDIYLEKDEELCEEALIEIIAHELHHIVVNELLEKQYSNIKNIKEKNILKIMGELLSEGTANYYLTNPLKHGGTSRNVWVWNLNNSNTIFHEVQKVIDKASADEALRTEEISHLFDEKLLGYSVGYMMIKTIDEELGREKVIECIEDCLKMIKYYNYALKKGDYNLPSFKISND